MWEIKYEHWVVIGCSIPGYDIPLLPCHFEGSDKALQIKDVSLQWGVVAYALNDPLKML